MTCPSCADRDVVFRYDGNWCIESYEDSKLINFCPSCGSALRSLTYEESAAVGAIADLFMRLEGHRLLEERLGKMTREERREYDASIEYYRRIKHGMDRTIEHDLANILSRGFNTSWDES